MCCLRKNPCEGFTAKEQGALKQGQDGQGVLQAANPWNIHLGMAQPAEEPALHLPHTSGGEKKTKIHLPNHSYFPPTPHQPGVFMVAEQHNIQ